MKCQRERSHGERERREVGTKPFWLHLHQVTYRRSLLRQGPCLRVPRDTPESLILLPSLLPPLLLSTVLLAARLRSVVVKLACPTTRVHFIIHHHQPFQNPGLAPGKTRKSRTRTKRSVCNCPQLTFQPRTSHLSNLQFLPSK